MSNTPAYTLTPQDRQQLEPLLALPGEQLAVVQALALLHEPCSRTTLGQILQKARILCDNGRVCNPQSVSALIPPLLKGGLVRHSPDGGVTCPPEWRWGAAQLALEGGIFPHLATVIRAVRPARAARGWRRGTLDSFSRGVREVWLGLLENDANHVHAHLELCLKFFPEVSHRTPPLGLCLPPPVHLPWLFSRQQPLPTLVLEEQVVDAFLWISPLPPLAQALQQAIPRGGGELAPRLRHWLVVVKLLGGHLREAEALLAAPDATWAPHCLWGWLASLAGDPARAIGHFEDALKEIRKATGKRKVFLDHPSGLFFLLALLAENSPQGRRLADDYLAIAWRNARTLDATLLAALKAVMVAMEGDAAMGLRILAQGVRGTRMDIFREVVTGPLTEVKPLAQMFCGVALHLLDPERADALLPTLLRLQEQAQGNGHHWVAREVAQLLGEMTGEDATGDATGATPFGPAMIHWLRMPEPWEAPLQALLALAQQQEGTATPKAGGGESRLVWLLGEPRKGMFTLQPREQKRLKSGGWSKGRPVALSRLAPGADDTLPLTPQDRQACDTIRQVPHYYGQAHHELDPQRTLAALVGHPHVYWEDHPQVNVELVAGEPELLIQEKNGNLTIRFAQDAVGEGVTLIRETPTRCRVIQVNARQREMMTLLGQQGLTLPASEKAHLLQAVPALSSLVTLHSEIGGAGEELPRVAADPTPHLHLLPHGEGIKLKMQVFPLGERGPGAVPGVGAATMVAEVEGQRVQTARPLTEEKRRCRELIAACPALAGNGGAGWEWTFDQPEGCLDLLLELQALPPEQARVAWPEGQKLQVSHPLSLQDMRLAVNKERDWFGLEGELRVDEALVLSLQQLLSLLERSPGRFVPLDEGRYLTLTNAFRRKLEELRDFSETKGGKQRVHPLALPALAALGAEAGAFSADHHWREQLKRLERAQALSPQVPSTCQAELRDYQVDGFRWMARLAAWGVGGCLADDMGLGKTIQTLALLLERAPGGPALVVAPTSVCQNWQEEARRWAPTLEVVVFGGSRRQELVQEAKPFQLVVCSYGLLQSEAALLGSVAWHTVVLDEAQAIKNRQTKRSQAAMGLQGAFRLLTTGTPVENHLGELWNLFRFINPGLLGSHQRFTQRFAGPIERDDDREARRRLKRLVQPFILRRTKSQVLEELPPRTEVTLHVTLDPEERAFYEALRRTALERLSSGAGEENRVRILAEIMTLRRACCHPRLAAPQAPLPGAKLTLFREVVAELLENGHKALVFSQFVDHLAILRRHLEEAGIPFQYLDGGTPARERKKRVDAFQGGEGALFLISLKAGGVGLNLTAADYVIHMDPWWNPAVEDQASDRVHRIGQERPVTIYRMIAQGTIEERIVALHRDKRALADGLLEGTGAAARLSAEELLALMRA